ncbi:MAG: ferredoxin [Bacteroidota bacterium]|nr:ferredoxin [Bacteroidota bacterium]
MQTQIGNPSGKVGKPHPDNVPGRFYVLDTCNGCGLCLSYAIHSFSFDDSGLFYYVYRQPDTEDETDDVRKAMSVCPMDCICDDGQA